MSHDEEPKAEASPVATSLSSPRGMLRPTANGGVIVDALAGRSSVFGFGCTSVHQVLQAGSQMYLGDSAAWTDAAEWDGVESEDAESNREGLAAGIGADDRGSDDRGSRDRGEGVSSPLDGPPALADTLQACLGKDEGIDVAHILLRPSADAAIDTAISLARRRRPGQAFRTIALVGSDHGRTGMCRSASGRPELHEHFGPMMAGFSHVPPGKIDALRAAVDDQTACVLLSPIDLGNGGVALEPEYLHEVRQICDDHDLLLVMDESQLVFGASGRWLTARSLANIDVDIAIASAGLFAGLPGGLVLAGEKVSTSALTDVVRFPLHAAILNQTLATMQEQELPQRVSEGMHPLAVSLARAVSGFEFVRDIHASGVTLGIETDLPSEAFLRAARDHGLRLARSGSTAVILQPPLVIPDDDQQLLLSRLGSTMESLERESSELAM